METLTAHGYSITFSTDIYGTIHLYVVENNGILASNSETKINELQNLPQLGISFYCGTKISEIKRQMYFLFCAINEQLALEATTFLDNFLKKPENLQHDPTPMASEVEKEKLN